MRTLLFFSAIFISLTFSTYSLYGNEDNLKIHYQRSAFEKNFPEADLSVYNTGELKSIFNLNLYVEGIEDVRRFIKRYGAIFGLGDERCEMILKREIKSGEISVLIFNKYCNGIEVFQDRLSIFLKNRILFGLHNGSRNTDGIISEPFQGRDAILNHLKAMNIFKNVIDARLVLYRFYNRLFPIYIVSADSGYFLSAYKYFINATDGKILFRLPLYKSIRGNVYLDSPEKDKNPSIVTLPDTLEYGILKNAVADVYSNCDPNSNCDSSKRVARPDNTGDFIYTPDESKNLDPFAEVMAYYHLNRLYNWFKGAGFEFNPFGVLAVVGFMGVGSEYDEIFQCNGYYLNRQVILGFCPKENSHNNSGRNINVAYDSDIIMHELTHGFFEEIYNLDPVVDNLGFSGMLLGLNEAIADFIPSHITDDSLIGRHLGGAISGESIRDLTNLRRCPYYLNGEPHNDGEIISTALWGARGLIHDREQFARVAFLAISGLNSSSSFIDYYNQVVNFVSTTISKVAAENIKSPFLSRNIDKCGRLIEVENGFLAQGHIFSATDAGLSSEVPYEVQFIYNLPDDNMVVNIDITGMNLSGSSSTDFIKFYVNYNRPVDFSFEGVKSDYVWIKRSQTLTDLKKGKYYVLPVGDGQGTYIFKFKFAYKEPAPRINSVDPEELKLNSTVEEFTINGENFQKGVKIKLPYGISYEDYDVVDSNNIIVYNLMVSDETQCGYNSLSVINPDGQKGVGKSLLLIVKGNDKCKCDITLECDEQCKCDPDCSDGGCGCSILY